MPPLLFLAAVVLAAVVVVWLLARSRIGRIVLAGLVALLAVGFVGRRMALKRLEESVPVRQLTVTEAAAEIGAGAGKVRVVVIYDPYCGRCREVVPKIAAYVRRRARDGVRLYAIALPAEANEVRTLLADDPSLFTAYQVLPYAPGELSAAMATVNVWVPSSFSPPLVSVLTADGARVGAGEGVSDLAELGVAIDAALGAPAKAGRAAP